MPVLRVRPRRLLVLAELGAQIARSLRAMWSPYDGADFEGLSEPDIEHIVAVSEAHDFGLCAASRNLR